MRFDHFDRLPMNTVLALQFLGHRQFHGKRSKRPAEEGNQQYCRYQYPAKAAQET
jgi:hypothetical protein